ncbi:MAG: hypothetical protein Q4G00_07140 [Clostridia bacterium]|nr:hypothetical protein [Clostridia bacterium]
MKTFRSVNRTITRFSPAAAQNVRNMLNSRLFQGYVYLTVAHYVLTFVSNLLTDTDLIIGLILLLVQGFITAECVILYQRKESRNLKHLSIFCLIGMIVMFLICLFLGATVLTLNMEYSAGTEEIVSLWKEADLSAGMPSMIMTVVSMGIVALALLFMWKALGMSADLLEHRGAGRNWYIPSAIALAVHSLASLVTLVLQPVHWINIVTIAVALAGSFCLALLFWQAGQGFRQAQ